MRFFFFSSGIRHTCAHCAESYQNSFPALRAKTLPWGGGSPRSNPYFKAKPKLSVFESRQFSGHFFLGKKFSKKCKML